MANSSDNMVERVAKTLAPAAFSIMWKSKLAQGAEQARAFAKARAILAAMREPTAEMLNYGWTACDTSSPEMLEAGWTAMIDAALRE